MNITYIYKYSVLEHLAMKIVQNCYFLLQVIHRFPLLVLKIYREVVKFNTLNLKDWEQKMIYQKVIHGTNIFFIYILNILN